MNTRALSVITAMLLLPAAAFAQKDRITLIDGAVIDHCTVTDYTISKLTYRKSGSDETQSSDKVARLEVAKVRDTYKRAFASAHTDEGPGNFLVEAQQQKSNFLKQFGYVEAAKLFLAGGQPGDAFSVLEELATEVPDSGFLPMLYRAKINYYLGQGKAKAGDALKVAKSYEQEAQVKGYPKGFGLEARYFSLMAQAAAGDMDGARLKKQLESLSRDASGYENVVHRVDLQIANLMRANGQLDEALAAYDELIEQDYSTDDIRAGAFLGRGQVLFAQATPAEPDGYRAALLSFLRVYIETPEASPEIVAESLYMAAKAAEQWGGTDSSRMARSLRYRLQRDFAGSRWASR